jgi:hypothetical protein
MSILRETEAPTEASSSGPTRFKTSDNKHPLRCWACGQLYFVNETIHSSVKRAAEIDPSENAFCCDDCAEGYEAERRT